MKGTAIAWVALFAFALIAGFAAAVTYAVVEGAPVALKDVVSIATVDSKFSEEQTTYEWLGQGDVYWTLENTGKDALTGLETSLLFPKGAMATSTQVWAYAAHPSTISNCALVKALNKNGTTSNSYKCVPYTDLNYYWDWVTPSKELTKTEKSFVDESTFTISAVDVKAEDVNKYKTHVTVPIGSSGEFNVSATDPKAAETATLDPYWNSSWTYRAHLNVSNNLPYKVWGNYTVNIPLNHSALLAASKCALANGDDLRVVYDNGVTATELDRWSNGTFDNYTDATFIWFQLQQNLTAWENNSANYWLYCNNPAAGSPPVNLSRVFLLGDDFVGADGSSPNTGLWGLTQNAAGDLRIINNKLVMSSSAGIGSTNIRTVQPIVSDKNSTMTFRWYLLNQSGAYSAAFGMNINGYSNFFDSSITLPQTVAFDTIINNGNDDAFWGISGYIFVGKNSTTEFYLSASNTTAIIQRNWQVGSARPHDSYLTTG